MHLRDERPRDDTSALGETPNLTAHDVAAYTGLSYHAVLRAIHRGELKAFKLCGRVRLTRSDVLAWIEAARVELERQAVPPETPPPETGSLEALRELDRRMR